MKIKHIKNVNDIYGVGGLPPGEISHVTSSESVFLDIFLCY